MLAVDLHEGLLRRREEVFAVGRQPPELEEPAHRGVLQDMGRDPSALEPGPPRRDLEGRADGRDRFPAEVDDAGPARSGVFPAPAAQQSLQGRRDRWIQTGTGALDVQRPKVRDHASVPAERKIRLVSGRDFGRGQACVAM